MSYFKPSYSGVGKMIRSGFMQAEMLARIEKIKAVAIAIAPRDVKDKDGVYYHDKFSTSVRARGGTKHDRAEGRLVNTHPAALEIEKGTEDTPAHNTLRKAIGG